MQEHKQHPFVARLEGLRDAKDRGALARLRRGLGKRMGTPEMYPYVVPFLPNFPAEQERYFLLASLFALHPEAASRGTSLGTVFRKIWEESGQTESIETRFTSLLSADPEDIGGYLRHAVSLAKSRTVFIDYHKLFYDLRDWDHPARFVQLSWARDFWRAGKETASDLPRKGDEA